MGFWNKVREELEFRGISRKELSAKSGVPMTTLNRALERDSNPFAADALRVANTLNIPLEKLLGISKNETQSIPDTNRNFLKQWNKLSQKQQKKLLEFLETIRE